MRRPTSFEAVTLFLVVLIAVGAGIALGLALDDSSQRSATGAADRLDAVEEAADAQPSTTTGETAAQPRGLTPDEQALLRRVREAPSTCQPLEHIFDELALVGCTSADDVRAQYSQFPSRIELDRAYAAVLDELGLDQGAGLDRCPIGIPSEQPWTRGDTQLGRLACFSRHGLAWMAWTHEPLRILAVYTAPEGMSSLQLHQSWAGGGRLDFFDDELAFYQRIPESHRASCAIAFVTGNTPVAGPPPAQGSTARCFVPDPKAPEDPLRSITVSYVQHPTLETMNAYYGQVTQAAGVSAANTGFCPDNPPGEGSWNRSGRELGRIACAVSATGAFIVWTTEPLLILATAIAPAELTLEELYDWWSQNAGPVFQAGG